MLRKLTLHHKQLAKANDQTVDQAIVSVGKDWENWSKLVKRAKSGTPIYQLKESLLEYLVSQMSAQVAEHLEIDCDLYMDKLLKKLCGEDKDLRASVKSKLEGYPLKIRAFPSYAPDMDAMCTYTLRAFSQQQDKLHSRELVEAINQKFFKELMHKPDSLTELGNKTVFEISFPKPSENGEVFLRGWQGIELPNNLKRWQVVNICVPLSTSEINDPTKLAGRWMTSEEPKISTLQSMELKLAEPSQTQTAMSQLMVTEETYLETLIKLVNESFRFSLLELTKVSEYIYSLINKYIEAVNKLLVAIIENLGKPFDQEIDQKWTQLINGIQQHINGQDVDIHQFNKIKVSRRGKRLQDSQVALADQGTLFGIDPLVLMIEEAKLSQLVWV